MTDSANPYVDEQSGDQDDHRTLPNPERGCGHLKRGKAYIRGLTFSPLGILPPWVSCDPAIPFQNIGTGGSFTRGYSRIDGLTFQLDTSGRVCEYVPESETGEDDYYEVAVSNMVQQGLYEMVEDVPNAEVDRHIDRVKARGGPVSDEVETVPWEAIDTAGHTDLLMRAGESYYPEPEDFSTECQRHGLSKAIPVSPNKEPPKIVPGITRCWIMHPNAGHTDFGGGIIGYAYIGEVAFTEPEDGEIPGYVEEYEEQNKLNVVDIEDPQPADDQPDDQSDVADFAEGE